jgi:SAM-dependent methyltransferase
MDGSGRDRQAQTARSWDVAALVYERDQEADIAFLRSGGNSLLGPEQRLLSGLAKWCKRAVHLQCAGGTDTLSLWKMGAAGVVGVDVSSRMIAVARHKAKVLAAPAQWYCCDVLDIPLELDATADLVYTGRGALPWMMDVQEWARVVARLLRPEGKLLVFEGHPLDWVWDMGASSYQFATRTGNYFADSVVEDRGWPISSDAIQGDASRDHLHVYERQWTLGKIMNSLIAVGMSVVHFEEYPDLYWNQFPNLPAELATRLPHTFSLLMRKDQIA